MDPRRRPGAAHRAAADSEPLARTYVITQGRSGAGPRRRFDLVTLILAAAGAADRAVPGLMPEHRAILALCRRPLSVAEIAAHLRLPFSAAVVLVGDLVDAGLAAERRPARAAAVDPALLREVINGLQRL
ncbi:DUF742 domain-containing protein [Catenulispora subtropica]|uniref:DUF742 domain-containing protein n=1 Tax=Catenulispora subtropica TaxID=450798 RepID=A0ABN2SEG9_9ACTN